MDAVLWILNAIWVVIKFLWMAPINSIEYMYPDSLLFTIIGHFVSLILFLLSFSLFKLRYVIRGMFM